MKHKPFAVIAPVAIAVAAILILGILAGISSTAAAGKTVKKPSVSKTLKMGGIKSAYQTQGSSNGKKRTELTLSASPKPVERRENGWLGAGIYMPVTLSGRLTSEGSGVAGAMIIFSCDGEPCEADETVQNPTAHYTDDETVHYANTDSGGHYIIGALFSDHTLHKITHEISASYWGDDHLHLKSSSASTKVK